MPPFNHPVPQNFQFPQPKSNDSNSFLFPSDVKLRFELVSGDEGNHFTVDPSSGLLALMDRLDYETAKKVILEAKLEGNPRDRKMVIFPPKPNEGNSQD